MKLHQVISFCVAIVMVACNQNTEQLVVRANSLRASGDLDSALTLYDLVLSSHQSSEAYNGRGLVKKLLGDTSGALVDYTKGIQLDSTNWSAYNNRGALLDLQGNHSDALKDLNRACAGDSRNNLFLFNLACAKVHAQDFQGALADIGRLRSLGAIDQFPNAFYNEGFAYAKLDSFYRAEESFTRALGLIASKSSSCNLSECLVNRGTNRISLNMYDSAYADLKLAEGLGDHSFEVFYQQAYALTLLKNWEEAIETYGIALEIDSTDAWAYWNLAYCKEAIGDRAGACSAYTKAVALGHGDPDGEVEKWCRGK